jgi:hypothetical protein
MVKLFVNPPIDSIYEIANPFEPTIMIAYVVDFGSDSSLHLRERNSPDLNDMFNDIGDLERNMRASVIQLETIYDPLERRDILDRRRGKELETCSVGQNLLSLEEMAKMTRSMANDLTRVKQGQFAHSSLGLDPRY